MKIIEIMDQVKDVLKENKFNRDIRFPIKLKNGLKIYIAIHQNMWRIEKGGEPTTEYYKRTIDTEQANKLIEKIRNDINFFNGNFITVRELEKWIQKNIVGRSNQNIRFTRKAYLDNGITYKEKTLKCHIYVKQGVVTMSDGADLPRSYSLRDLMIKKDIKKDLLNSLG